MSEFGDIECFIPQPSPNASPYPGAPVVWAIDELHLPNYLLPRDCPRVCFYATAESRQEDVERLLGASNARHVVAIEFAWLEIVLEKSIWVYELDEATFEVFDAGAGYHVSRESVYPSHVRNIECPFIELLASGAELRIVNDLLSLQEIVVSSSLQFSCIRMRNLGDLGLCAF